jgi:hypothetical protein
MNAFYEVHEREHANEDREFALGAGTSCFILTDGSEYGGFRRYDDCGICKLDFGADVV